MESPTSHRSAWQLIRFVIAGGFNTLASYLTFALCIRLGWHFVPANLAGFVVGILLGFKLHGTFVFDHSGEKRFLRFALIAVLLLGFSLLIQAIVRQWVNDYVAGALAAAITVPTSFLLNRALVFHAPDHTEP